MLLERVSKESVSIVVNMEIKVLASTKVGNKISKEESEHLLFFTHFSNPLFIWFIICNISAFYIKYQKKTAKNQES